MWSKREKKIPAGTSAICGKRLAVDVVVSSFTKNSSRIFHSMTFQFSINKFLLPLNCVLHSVAALSFTVSLFRVKLLAVSWLLHQSVVA